MENFLFSFHATAPVFLLMVLGYVFRLLGWMDQDFAAKMNRFVFKVPLPVLVFNDLATVDFHEVWDTKFVGFCFVVTLASIVLVLMLSCLWKEKEIRGEFVQVSYRSSAAILGVALIQNIYGNAGMAPLMIIGSVPLYNVMAVVVLTALKPGQNKMDLDVVKKALKGILTNPIIIGIAAGLLWSVFGIPMPTILGKTLSNIGGIATPMGLMAMGASFEIGKALGQVKPAIVASFLKLIGFCAIFLPVAARMGFRREQLIAILVMLGSASTVSCYVMAKNMGHEGTLTSSVVMITTVFAAVTLTMWLYVLRVMGLV